MNSMTARTIGRIGIPTSVGEAMEAIIITLNRLRGKVICLCDTLCRMALRTGGQGDSLLINRRIGIDHRFDPVETMTGCAGGRIASPPCSKNSVDALNKLFRNIRMASPAGMGDTGSEDGRFWIGQGSQVMTPVATGTGHLSRFSMDTLPKFLLGHRLPQAMLSDKGHIRMTASACPVDIRNVDH